jgi:hypothetical protein
MDDLFHKSILPQSQRFRYRCAAPGGETARRSAFTAGAAPITPAMVPPAVRSSRLITVRFTISTITR